MGHCERSGMKNKFGQTKSIMDQRRMDFYYRDGERWGGRVNQKNAIQEALRLYKRKV